MADVSVDPKCKEANEHFGEGVRAFVLEDFEKAALALSKATEILVNYHNDELHESLGEVYLYYGKSLLGYYRATAGEELLNRDSDTSDSSDEEADEGIESGEPSEKDTEKTEETQPAKEDTTETQPAKEDATADTNSAKSSDVEKKPENVKAETNGKATESAEVKPGTSSNKADTDDEDDDDDDLESKILQKSVDSTTDLQLAWEVLELARKIFIEQDDKKSLADCLVVLAEVALESENFNGAKFDLKDALDIQKEIYGKDSRTIAETLYKAGMAYSGCKYSDEAIAYFEESLEYLRNRIKTLEEMDPVTQEHKDEIEEVKSLIPEIEEKISDVKQLKEEGAGSSAPDGKAEEMIKEEAVRLIQRARLPTKLPQNVTLATNPDQPLKQDKKPTQVTNISHLVKRKRKIDEVEEKAAEESPAKKPAS